MSQNTFDFHELWSLPVMQAATQPAPLPTSFTFSFQAPTIPRVKSTHHPRKTTKAWLVRLFREDTELLDQLLSYLDPHDLASLARMNRLINGEMRAYSRRIFSINRVLSPFFTDCNSFREMQSRTGTLISGSTALQLFERTTYSDADLDVYVEHRYALEVVKYLDLAYYTFTPRETQAPTAEETLEDTEELLHAGHYLGQGIANVLDYSRNDKKIQVIVSKRTPIDIVLHFHSTCVMNIISHSTAYSLFPSLTFAKISRTFTSPSSAPKPGTKWTIARQKYTNRGFKFVQALDGDPLHGHVERYIGDSRTWTVPLSPELPELGEDTLSICSFQEVYDKWLGSSIEYDLCESSRLRFVYTTARHERATLRSAWNVQLTKPRGYSESVAKLDRPLCDALYVYRAAAAAARAGPMPGRRPLGALTFVNASRARSGLTDSDSE